MQLDKKFANYLRLIRFDKPIGTVLLLMPTLWALWVASYGIPDFWILFVFTLGVFIMRSVGCTINDILDRDFDGYVERTKNRPLVTNIINDKVTVSESLILIGILSACALGLVLSLHNIRLLAHCIIALLLTCIYPCCKRFFPCPQFVLGLAFSYGIPMAFVAIIGRTSLVTWLLYAASVILTIIYDSFYAMADLKDDQKLGLRSSVILFGKSWLYIIVALQILLLINLIMIGYLLKFYIYYCLVFIVLLLFVYQIKLVKSGEPLNCFRAFKSSAWVGFFIFLGFFREYY